MSWDFTRPVEIVPTGQADQRTKNRIREHSLVPRAIGKGEDAPASKFFMSLGQAKLFQCKDEGCDWIGWLPVDQFEIK